MASPRLSIPETLADTFMLFRQHGIGLTLEFIAIGIGIDAALLLFAPVDGAAILGDRNSTVFIMPAYYVYFFATSVCYTIISGFGLLRIWMAEQNPPGDARRAMAIVRLLIVPLVVLQFGVDVLVLLGYFCFIIPSIFVLAASSTLLPAILIENQRWQSIHRCLQMTRGHIRRLMMLWAVLFVPMLFGVVFTQSSISQAAPVAGGILGVIIQCALVDLAPNVFSAIAVMMILVVYKRLSEIERGGSPKEYGNMSR